MLIMIALRVLRWSTIHSDCSNTVKMGMWSLLCVMVVVAAIVLLAVFGSYLPDTHLVETAVGSLTTLGSALATLGSVATGAKGARDAVGSYSDAVSVRTEVSYPPARTVPRTDGPMDTWPEVDKPDGEWTG